MNRSKLIVATVLIGVLALSLANVATAAKNTTRFTMIPPRCSKNS